MNYERGNRRHMNDLEDEAMQKDNAHTKAATPSSSNTKFRVTEPYQPYQLLRGLSATLCL